MFASCGSRAELEVNVALIAEAPALPMLRGIRDEAFVALDRACARLVPLVRGEDRGGEPRIDVNARCLHALIDGLAVHLMMRDPQADTSWAIDILHDELRRLRAEARRPSPGG